MAKAFSQNVDPHKGPQIEFHNVVLEDELDDADEVVADPRV